MIASDRDHSAVVETLIANGADINIANEVLSEYSLLLSSVSLGK